jgi:hypothetical protein
VELNLDEVTKGFARLDIKSQIGIERVTLDTKRYREYYTINDKVLFILSKCLGEFD